MKTIKFKHSGASLGHLTLAHPGATPGQQASGAIVLAVVGLPDTATMLDARRILNTTILPPWVYQVDASQAGKNLYRREHMTADQITAAPAWWHAKTPA